MIIVGRVLKSKSLQYCRVPKNGLPKNGQAGIFLKIRTTPGWKLNSELHANSVCCEDDFFSGIADFETTPRQRVETFQPLPRPPMRCVRVAT